MIPQPSVSELCADEFRRPECDLVLPLDRSRTTSLARALSRALRDEPHFRYVVPDSRERRRILSWFFDSAVIPTSVEYGEVYTTAEIDAGVLWFRPERSVTFKQMLRTAMSAMPMKVAPSILRRCFTVGKQMERVADQLAREPHWYLVTLGVGHSKNSDPIARALLEPVLVRADVEQRSCYVESFHEGNLRFYESLGFRIEGAGDISKDGPSFWAMIRAPQSARRPPDDRIANCSIS
jgi:hypothetical protein